MKPINENILRIYECTSKASIYKPSLLPQTEVFGSLNYQIGLYSKYWKFN